MPKYLHFKGKTMISFRSMTPIKMDSENKKKEKKNERKNGLNE